jgi:hypothetical protein
VAVISAEATLPATKFNTFELSEAVTDVFLSAEYTPLKGLVAPAVQPSILEVVVLYRIPPLTPTGLWAVVPLGSFRAFVLSITTFFPVTGVIVILALVVFAS